MNPLVADCSCETSFPLLVDFPIDLAPVVQANVQASLLEDVGAGDLTASLIPTEKRGQATVLAREEAVLCGRAWFDAAFQALDPSIVIRWHVTEGDRVRADQVLCEIEGNACAMLTAERTALNFLQLLSGVATKTRFFADLIAHTTARVVDTRKTLPGLRMAQKYAVRVGGGANHRLALWDAILIKENHIMAAGGIAAAMSRAHAVADAANGRCRFIQVEVESLSELTEALNAGAKMILLDNFSLAQLSDAVAYNKARPEPAILEASGGVSVDSLKAIAETGVDRISIGTLTKDVKALDLSMRFRVGDAR